MQVPFAAAKDFPALMDDLDAEIAGRSDTLKGLVSPSWAAADSSWSLTLMVGSQFTSVDHVWRVGDEFGRSVSESCGPECGGTIGKCYSKFTVRYWVGYVALFSSSDVV